MCLRAWHWDDLTKLEDCLITSSAACRGERAFSKNALGQHLQVSDKDLSEENMKSKCDSNYHAEVKFSFSPSLSYSPNPAPFWEAALVIFGDAADPV